MAQGESIELSSRIGATIEPKEREYFGFLGGIQGYLSARVVADDAEKSLRFIVTYEREGTQRDTVISVGDSLRQDLAAYVDQFETLFTGKWKHLGWDGLRVVVSPRNPFREDVMSLRLMLRSGEIITGTLVYFNEDVLVLAPEDKAREWLKLGSNATVFIPEEIIRIETDPAGAKNFFTDFDVALSGNKEIYRQELMPALKEGSLFVAVPSPEVQLLIDRKLAVKEEIAPLQTSEEVLDQIEPAQFSIMLSYSRFLVNTPNSYGQREIGGELINRRVIDARDTRLSIHAAYDFHRFFRLSAGVSMYQEPERPSYALQGYEMVSGKPSLEVAAYVVPIPRRKTLYRYWDRFEISVGAGVIWWPVTVESHVTSKYEAKYPSHTTSSAEALGGIFLANVGYYVWHSVSFVVGWRYATYKDVNIERHGLMSRVFKYELNFHAPYTVSLDGLDMHASFRIHF